MQPMISRPAAPLRGRCTVPGDKSISHRAVMLGAVSVGQTTIHHLLEADDVLATIAAVRRLGVRVVRAERGTWRIDGRGVGGLTEPDQVLDLGNSGTGVRLLMGLLASHPFLTFLTGDDSLRGRPMNRVMAPLRETGARFWYRAGGRLPLAVCGAGSPLPITYRLPVPSAQVKSAILLAGLNSPGETTVIEPLATRDHSERLLRHFGADVRVGADERGQVISLVGQPELTGRTVDVPADVSSAAFPLVAAAVVPGSAVRLERIGINPLRTGLIDTLGEMGADIRLENRGEASGEPIADLVVTARPLQGVVVPAERAPRMIDEFPILAVAAACAAGVSRMCGLAELKVKESNRLAAIAEGLAGNGIAVRIGDDWLEVTGCGGPPPGGGLIRSHFDHRIAMAFLVLGAASRAAVTVDDTLAISTSFPDFREMMNGLGAAIGDVPQDLARSAAG